MSKSKIIVCAHKKDFVMDNELYMPLQVGKATSKVDLGFQGDDTGDNISAKNPNYCELTGLYWAWKNLKDVDYIGLAHYRRYFDFMNSGYGSYTGTDFNNTYNSYLHPEDLLGDYDIILPQPSRMDYSVGDDYIYAHIMEDFYIMNRVILKHYPDYEATMSEFFYRDNRRICFNMFFTSREVFNHYNEWLFPLLFEVEQHIRLSGYKFQQRIFGFMSEMLLPLYCLHNKLKIKFVPICMIGDETCKKNKLKMSLLSYRNNIKFWMLRPKLKNVDCYGRKCHIDLYFKLDGINI